jgi:hypothetical protein
MNTSVKEERKALLRNQARFARQKSVATNRLDLAKDADSCWLSLVGLIENGSGILAVRVCLSIDNLVHIELV